MRARSHLLLLLLAACGPEPLAGLRPESPPDPPLQPGPSVGPATPVQPTAPATGPVPAGMAFTGHFVSEVIGNCIHEEEWLSFSEDGSFVHTRVDRNACQPSARGVFPSPGTATFGDDGVLTLTWTGEGRVSTRRFTHAIGGNPLAGKLFRPDRPFGPRLLWTTAFLGRDGAYRRFEEQVIESGPSVRTLERIEIELRMTPTSLPDLPTGSCMLGATLTGALEDGSGDERSGKHEAPFLRCVHEPSGELRLLTVIPADQQEQVRAIEAAFTGPDASLGYLLSRNLPRFLLAPAGEPVALLQENVRAPFAEVLGPPPERVE